MCTHKQFLLTSLSLLLLATAQMAPALSEEVRLKGGVSESIHRPPTPGPATGATSLAPSVAGPAVVGPDGSMLGTLSMQGLPKGTVLMPSAVGPLLIGPRGEMRGTLESYATGGAPPAVGMGPVIGYHAAPELLRVRGMFNQRTPFPLSRTVTSMPGQYSSVPGTAAAAAAETGPGVREFARVIPRQ